MFGLPKKFFFQWLGYQSTKSSDHFLQQKLPFSSLNIHNTRGNCFKHKKHAQLIIPGVNTPDNTFESLGPQMSK